MARRRTNEEPQLSAWPILLIFAMLVVAAAMQRLYLDLGIADTVHHLANTARAALG